MFEYELDRTFSKVDLAETAAANNSRPKTSGVHFRSTQNLSKANVKKISQYQPWAMSNSFLQQLRTNESYEFPTPSRNKNILPNSTAKISPQKVWNLNM